MDDLQKRIARMVSEDIEVVAYDSEWARMFEEERILLSSFLPQTLVRRIEHFGSTAVPNLCAKPIIDILLEVSSLEECVRQIVPIMLERGYDYFWRPLFERDEPPYYAWFVKRNKGGQRTHHIHMVEGDSVLWERLLFRDYLIANPDSARKYEELKMRLCRDFPNNRVAYTQAKTEFVENYTKKAKEVDMRRS